MTEDQLLTRQEVAGILRVEARTVSKLIADGELRATTIHGSYRVRRSWLQAYIDGRTEDPSL